MGKRYFCDFCQKTFPNNADSRKKHNEGNYHQTQRNLYYAAYKDLATVLYEERDKRPCFKFLSSRHCPFGLQCKNSHRSPAQLQYLEDLYRVECHNKVVKFEEIEARKLNLLKQRQRQQVTNKQHSSVLSDLLSREEEELLEQYLPSYTLPKSLAASRTPLPASLVPPTFKNLIDANVTSSSSDDGGGGRAGSAWL